MMVYVANMNKFAHDFAVSHGIFIFLLFSGVTEGAFLGELTNAAKKRSAAGMGVAHTVVIKCSTGILRLFAGH